MVLAEAQIPRLPYFRAITFVSMPPHVTQTFSTGCRAIKLRHRPGSNKVAVFLSCIVQVVNKYLNYLYFLTVALLQLSLCKLHAVLVAFTVSVISMDSSFAQHMPSWIHI